MFLKSLSPLPLFCGEDTVGLNPRPLAGQREESICGGAIRTETMLGVSKGEVWNDELGDELLQNFGCWIEEGYWSEGGALVFGFARFGYGKVNRVLPYCWEVGVLIGQVLEVSEILKTSWSQVFQLEDIDITLQLHITSNINPVTCIHALSNRFC